MIGLANLKNNLIAELFVEIKDKNTSKYLFDLRAYCKLIMKNLGVIDIDDILVDTYSSNNIATFYSYRKKYHSILSGTNIIHEKNIKVETGRQLTIIGIKA